MRRIRIILPVLLLAVMVSCCQKGDDYPGDPNAADFYNLQPTDTRIIYQDTITPPSNPLTPPSDKAVCVRGALTRTWVSDNACSAAIRTDRSTVYVLARGASYMRFNDPLLAGLHMADTLAVTGEVFDRPPYYTSYLIKVERIELLAAYND